MSNCLVYEYITVVITAVPDVTWKLHKASQKLVVATASQQKSLHNLAVFQLDIYLH